jgi:hypothetical protein
MSLHTRIIEIPPSGPPGMDGFGDEVWTREAAGYVHPTTTTDAVVAGSGSAPLGSEKLRVVGSTVLGSTSAHTVELFGTLVKFDVATPDSEIGFEIRTTAGTGSQLFIHGQNLSSAAGSGTAGRFVGQGGSVVGIDVDCNGADALLWGGAGGGIGGHAIVRPGASNSGGSGSLDGDIRFEDADTADGWLFGRFYKLSEEPYLELGEGFAALYRLFFDQGVTEPRIFQENQSSSGSGVNMNVRAQGTTVGTGNGGILQLQGGRRNSTGLKGGVRLQLNPDDSAVETMVECVEVAASRRVVSLCRGANLTTTQMPASSGDRVVYLENAATDPAAAPVGGGIIYESAGALVHYGTSSTVTTVAPA